MSVLSSDQFKALSRHAFSQARGHREAGDLNAADEAMRFGAVYREQALYGTRPNGSTNHPTFQPKTTWRYGDTPSKRVLP